MELNNPQIENERSELLKNKNIKVPCHLKKIPLWLVLLDNVPTLLLFFLGFIIVHQVSVLGAVIFGVYALFSVVWFWARICPYCHHYDTLSCPCGYGAISSKIFKGRDSKLFKKVFRRNITIQFPNWFVPLAVVIYLISTRYSKGNLYLAISFVIIGFVIIPAISKLVGCRNCKIKEDCPWMAGNRKD